MATPPLDLDALLASFPDNTSRLIIPENVRDFVQSVELKYDNYVVVKPTQPNGNKFPDPVGGKIYLDNNTSYIINGQVTVGYPIVLPMSSSIQAVSFSSSNALLLDAGAGAVSLFESVASADISMDNLILGTLGASQTLFNLSDASLVDIRRCGIFAPDPGSIGSTVKRSGQRFENVVFASNQTPLTITGTFASFEAEGTSNTQDSPFNTTGDTFDISGATYDFISMFRCTNNCTVPGKYFIKVGSDAIATSATFTGNRNVNASDFIDGADAQSIPWTFSGNSGIENTNVNGFVAMSGNSIVTVNPGINVWAPVAGVTTLASTATRYSMPANSTLRYLGSSDFKGVGIVECSLYRIGGTFADNFELSVFKNGSLLTVSGENFISEAAFASNDSKTLNFQFPVEASTNDDFLVALRCTSSGTTDLVCKHLQMTIR